MLVGDLRVWLARNGVQPVAVQNTDDSFARACELQPDVVVVDLETSSAPALRLPQLLRSDERTQDAIIIALTGDGFGSSNEQRNNGVDRLLPKPSALLAAACGFKSARRFARTYKHDSPR